MNGVGHFFLFKTSEDGKQEKKTDQPPSSKKAKVKTKTVDLPVQNSLHWQLSNDVLNTFVENEVTLKNELAVKLIQLV